MMFIWQNADKFGNLAQLVLTVTAIIALVFGYQQVRSAERIQREATAKEIYRDYLNVAFANPELASPDDGDKKIISEYKYRWFVAVMLNACEEILASTPNDPTWKDVILAEMEYHKTYLNSKFFLSSSEDRGWELYSRELKEAFESKFG